MADDVKRAVQDWTRAIMVLDASELLVRDIIERELEGVAQLGHVKLTAAKSAVRSVMSQVASVRTQAWKTAFRILQGRGVSDIAGHSLSVWASFFCAQDLAAIESAIRVALFTGASNVEVAAKVVGTAGLRGVDGCAEFSRHKLAHLAKQQIRGKRHADHT